MALQNPGKLSALVVDDFSSFRLTLISMLNKLGIKNIEEAGKAVELIKWCRERKFDLILCDYNLGSGKNGQQLLEELRFKKIINRSTLFVMVTAEASKEMVLSAYDWEPDDYLMKPLNLRVLEQRLGRLVQNRDALAQVYGLLDAGNLEQAAEQLRRLLAQRGRHTHVAQKLLGETLLSLQHYRAAETLYQEVLDDRRLDWAVLGLAKVKRATGEHDRARDILTALVGDNRLYLPAYDELAAVCEHEGDYAALQRAMQQAVEVSPKSILRQRKLSEVASANGDVLSCAQAAGEAMKLGEHSCHQDLADGLRFLKAVGDGLQNQTAFGNRDVVDESRKCMAKLLASQRLSPDQEAEARLLAARVHEYAGAADEARKLIKELQFADGRSKRNLDVDLARLAYLNSAGKTQESENLLNLLLNHYQDQPDKLERLDQLLPEPRNETNRKRVAQLNKEGIESYKNGHYDAALELFRRATLLFPSHLGLQLNHLQTLVAKSKQVPGDEALRERATVLMRKLESVLERANNPAQLERLRQLRVKATQREVG